MRIAHIITRASDGSTRSALSDLLEDPACGNDEQMVISLRGMEQWRSSIQASGARG